MHPREGRARVWRLYMVASALPFQFGEITVNQALAVARRPDGSSGMPMTRAAFLPLAEDAGRVAVLLPT